MSGAPVRLVSALTAAPRPLIGSLATIDAAAVPAWIGARAGVTRPLLAAPLPPTEAEQASMAAAAAAAGQPAPVVDPAVIAQAVEAARATAIAEGEKAGIAAGQAKVDAIVERYADGIAHLADVQARRAGDDAESAVALALVVAQEILGRELEIDRTFLVTMVTEALATVGHEKKVRVRLGSTDLAYLDTVRPEVLTSGVEVVADDSLGIGGCVVESEHRVVDASLSSRLAAVGAALRQALVPTPGTPAA